MAGGRIAKKKELAEGGGKKSAGQMSLKEFKKARARKAAEKSTAHPEFIPQLPSVNLFPETVRDDIVVARSWKLVIGAAGLVIVGLGYMWWSQSGPLNEANESLLAAQQRSEELQTEIRALTPVKTLYDQITSDEAIVNGALANRVDSVAVMDQFDALIATGGLTVNNVAFAYEEAPTTEGKCPSADPFSKAVTVGCINFKAFAPNSQAVAQYLTAAETNPFFANAFTTGVRTNEDGTAEFSGTIGVSPMALEVPLTPEQIAALTTPADAKEDKKPAADDPAAEQSTE